MDSGSSYLRTVGGCFKQGVPRASGWKIILELLCQVVYKQCQITGCNHLIHQLLNSRAHLYCLPGRQHFSEWHQYNRSVPSGMSNRLTSSSWIDHGRFSSSWDKHPGQATMFKTMFNLMEDFMFFIFKHLRGVFRLLVWRLNQAARCNKSVKSAHHRFLIYPYCLAKSSTLSKPPLV